MLKFAISEQDITPTGPMYLCGYTVDNNNPLRRGKSDGVLDPILCETMMLEVNGQKFLLVSLDFTFVIKQYTEVIRRDISNEFLIPVENIIVSCLHTHSGPFVFLPPYVSKDGREKIIEMEYLNNVKEKIFNSVAEVTRNLEPVESYYSLSKINGYYGNRNVKGGQYDDSFHVIRFKNTQGKIVGCFANISCHPTILKGNNLKFSADLLGIIRRNLAEEWNAPVILTNGASGDVSSRFFTRDNSYETLIQFGTEISNQVLTNYNESPLALGDFKVKKVRLERKYSPKEDMELAGVDLLLKPGTPEILINEVKRKISYETIHFDLESYVYSMGPISLVTFPGECVTGLADKIKSNSKADVTMFICYANDFWIYFVPEEEYGDYFESIVSLFPKGLADEYAQLIIDELRKL